MSRSKGITMVDDEGDGEPTINTWICECEDWRSNIEILNAPYLCNLLAVGNYIGKKFDYCPWCGKELILVR